MGKPTGTVEGDLRKAELRCNSFRTWSPPLLSPSLSDTCGELGTERWTGSSCLSLWMPEEGGEILLFFRGQTRLPGEVMLELNLTWPPKRGRGSFHIEVKQSRRPELQLLYTTACSAAALQSETSNFHSLLVHLPIICHLIVCITQKLVTWRAWGICPKSTSPGRFEEPKRR